jgi:hypothetical protein
MKAHLAIVAADPRPCGNVTTEKLFSQAQLPTDNDRLSQRTILWHLPRIHSRKPFHSADVCLRSSTRPSAKQGDSSAMKSRINCPFTVSFGRNRQMLLASSRRCVIALGWSLHSCPSMPLRQTVHAPPTSCFFAPRFKGSDTAVSKRRVRSNDAHVRCRLQLNRRLNHFRARFLQLNRRPTVIFAAKS